MRWLIKKLRRGPSCAEIMEVLQAYLDGEIDAATAASVAAHLDECTECGRESDVYRTIKQSLAARRRPIDPDVLAALRRFGQELIDTPD